MRNGRPASSAVAVNVRLSLDMLATVSYFSFYIEYVIFPSYSFDNFSLKILYFFPQVKFNGHTIFVSVFCIACSTNIIQLRLLVE